jgi:hypothetical protein
MRQTMEAAIAQVRTGNSGAGLLVFRQWRMPDQIIDRVNAINARPVAGNGNGGFLRCLSRQGQSVVRRWQVI